jgi:uncharacterized protein YcbK (DUF882 family)
VHVGNARLRTRRLSAARVGYSCGLALLAFLIGSKSLQNAVAEGDTRTITLHHIHTGEDITITYKRDGRYDEAALTKLNWFLRDWRRSEETQMDPRLIDLVWEVQREAAPNTPIQVVCGYRSPQTNEMLRHRSAASGVARYSQHMLGRAMDFYIPGVPLEQLREYGLRLARGGVGFYPESGSPFVHMDVGSIRMWPRMTREQLVRVFPDQRTVQIPIDGKPLAGYALALAEVKSKGSTPSDTSLAAAHEAGVDVGAAVASNDRPAGNPFAKLLGLRGRASSNDEDDDADSAPPPTVAVAAAPAFPPQPKPVAFAAQTPAVPADAEPTDAAPSAPQSKPAVLAGLAPNSNKKPATTTIAAKIADATAKLKLVHIATLAAAPAAAASTPAKTAPAAGTPNQVIVARGYWQGPTDGTVAANPLDAASFQRHDVILASADTTGTIAPLASPRDDHAASSLTLAYADQPGRDDAAPTGIAALQAAATPVQQAGQAGTTIAIKRAADQAVSAIKTASASSVNVIKTSVDLQNPWLRAIVLSPSVHRFLTTVALGERDFRSLAALMVKPKNAVVMTFAADPNPGLDQDHFSGAAIVFVSTVTYPTHTASLQ